ncbi:hypothetical protein ACQUJV_14420 [Ralstonia pseudosolanacearum]
MKQNLSPHDKKIGQPMSNASHALDFKELKIFFSKSEAQAVASGSTLKPNASFTPVVKPSKFVKRELKNKAYAALYNSCVGDALQHRKTTLHKMYPHEYNSHRGCRQRAKTMHIKFDNRLKDFRDFLVHLGPRPDESWSVDRIDPYKGYVPGNVRWATKMEQTANRKVTKWHKVDGKSVTTKQLANFLGLPYATLYKRLRRGWTITRLLDERKKGGAISQWGFPEYFAHFLEPKYQKRTAVAQPRIRWFIKYFEDVIGKLCPITQDKEKTALLKHLEKAKDDLNKFLWAEHEKFNNEVDELMNAMNSKSSADDQSPA